MRRRQFITFLSGAAAWPVAARAQRQDRTRRVGVLMALAQSDPGAQLRAQAFEAGAAPITAPDNWLRPPATAISRYSMLARTSKGEGLTKRLACA